jgi:hypothetical protein
MAIKKDTLDGLLAGRDPQAVFANDGLFDELPIPTKPPCAGRSQRDPAGEGPARVGPSEPSGNECCGCVCDPAWKIGRRGSGWTPNDIAAFKGSFEKLLADHSESRAIALFNKMRLHSAKRQARSRTKTLIALSR